MSNMTIFAWMNDWQMSAHLAKLSTTYSYELIFCESLIDLPVANSQILMIVDMGNVQKEDLEQIHLISNDSSIFIIGYAQLINGEQMKYFKECGCDMVLRRNKLLKNLESILKKINNAD